MGDRQSAADYDLDFTQAKSIGIDAFALNIAKIDSYTDTQLGFAYESAEKNGMKVFISFDYNYYETGDEGLVADKMKTYCGKAAQLKIGEKCFLSTFVGDKPGHTLNVGALREQAGTELYVVPNFSPYDKDTAASPVSDLDGAFNWVGWDSNGANRAPDGTNVTTTDQDKAYTDWLGDKAYMAPVSPWFWRTEAGNSWAFPGDLLWFRRWNEILASAPEFVEIVTWNDYGENSYIGPDWEDTIHGNVGEQYVVGMPHGGFRDVAAPFIAAYKAGQQTPTVTEDKLVYWYRPSMGCSGATPGAETLQEAVFVIAMLTADGKVTATSGANTQTFDAKAGISAFQVAMGAGKQTFALEGAKSLTGTGSLEIKEACDGNVNVFVGTVA